MQAQLNKKIYSQAAVEEAVKAFNGLADLKRGQNARYFLVEIKKIEADFKDVFLDEFYNFVLSSMRK